MDSSAKIIPNETKNPVKAAITRKGKFLILLNTTLLRRLNKGRLVGPVIINPLFNFMTEVTDEALDGPSRRVAEGANCVAFDLF